MPKPLTTAVLTLISISGKTVVVSTAGTRAGAGAKIVDWNINWDDGVVNREIIHYYEESKDYEVELTVIDSKGNSSTAMIIVPFNQQSGTTIPPPPDPPGPPGPALGFVTPSTLPTGLVGSPYSLQIVVAGGTGPYTFVKIAGNEAPGLLLSSSGLYSGTPNAVIDTTMTVRVTDSVGASVTRIFSHQVVVLGGSPDAYFDFLNSRSDVYVSGGERRAYRYNNQSIINAHSQRTPNPWVTFDPVENAARLVIPTWRNELYELVEPITPASDRARINSNNINIFTDETGLKFGGTERLKVQRSGSNPITDNGDGTLTVFLERGTIDPPLSHPAGAQVLVGTNNLLNQVRPPINTIGDENHRYLFTADLKWHTSWLGEPIPYSTGIKWLQLEGGYRIWWEPQVGFNGILDGVPTPGFDRNQHVGVYSTRTYNGLGGEQSWADQSGRLLCSGATCTPVRATNFNPVEPMLNRFIIKPNRWIRLWILVDVRVNDYDYISTWIADKDTLVQIYDRIPASIFVDGANPNSIRRFYFEYNTSDNNLFRYIDERDLIGWFRWMVCLIDPPAGLSGLLIKPTT